MTMAWIGIGAAVLGAGASVYGANKQAKGAERAGDINMDMFNVLNRQQQPFMQGGYGAMGRLNTLLGLNPNPRAQPGPRFAPGQSFVPTPGGGVQPIMQLGPPQAPAHDVHIPRSPQGPPMARMRDLLALRAANGDREAARILGVR